MKKQSNLSKLMGYAEISVSSHMPHGFYRESARLSL